MKKRILFILFLFSNFNGFTQVKFGITAGLQFSNILIVDNNTNSRMGFNAGGVMNAPISDGIDFNLQLLVSGKGYKYTDIYGYKDIVRPLYLELPAVVRFNFNSGSDSKIFLGAGGYYALGIAGSQIYYTNGNRESQSIKFGSDVSNDDFKQFDAGLVFQFGGFFRENYEGHFFYDMGLTRIIPGTTSNSFNRVYGFNLTWFLK